MSTPILPALFISHGSPMLPFEDIPARAFIQGLGARLARPKAILCISAHWETPAPAVSGAERPETIHDFYGFPEALYRLSYKAPGAPWLAGRVCELLAVAGLPASVDPARGLDHGAWNPLLLMYPAADIPVTQLSIQHQAGPGHQLAVGRALKPLRAEGILVLASGAAVHNLRQFQIERSRTADWAITFDDWLAERVQAGDTASLIEYRRLRPDGVMAHPRDEHLLPLFAAMGAGEGTPGRVLHRSFDEGSIGMAAYGWGEIAPEAHRAA